MEKSLVSEETQKDFFISYAEEDWQEAKWINQQLKDAGYSTILANRDFLPGENVVLEIDKGTRAKHTIAVLSPDYLTSDYTKLEWAAALYQDPTGMQGLLLPIRVRPCDVQGVLAPLIYIDLVGLQDEEKAQSILLAGVKQTPKQLKPVDFSSLQLATTQVSVVDSVQQVRFGDPFPDYWNVPRRHAPYFTGRDEQLQHIFQAFTQRDSAQIPRPQAIAGLGGLGKTQTAAEYAYRYRRDYQAVLWVRADSQENLLADFQSLVRLLHLPIQEDPMVTMRSWFTAQSNWLLIFDNADDLQIVDPFLPHTQRGHVLLTTRVRAANNVAQPSLLEPLPPAEGALCILRRSGSLSPSEQLQDISSARVDAAMRLSELMEGLPLALEQAGAYIEETGNTEIRYLKLYEQYRPELSKRQFGALPNYPQPVATAWTFSKGIVQRKELASFELLQLCAFLAPDAIPEEIFTLGAPALGPTLGPAVATILSLDSTTIILRKYSLLNREVRGNEAIPRFSIHRIMQEILRDEMDEETKKLWAERAVRAVALALGSVDKYLLRPQIIHCLSHIQQWNMTFPEAERLRDANETDNNLDK